MMPFLSLSVPLTQDRLHRRLEPLGRQNMESWYPYGRRVFSWYCNVNGKKMIEGVCLLLQFRLLGHCTAVKRSGSPSKPTHLVGKQVFAMQHENQLQISPSHQSAASILHVQRTVTSVGSIVTHGLCHRYTFKSSDTNWISTSYTRTSGVLASA